MIQQEVSKKEVPSKMQEKWLERIDLVTAQVVEHFGRLSKEVFNRKEDNDSWSIAQNLDHLITINESYFPLFEEIIQGGYRPSLLSKWRFLTSYLGNFILKSVQPDNEKKVKTFPIWEPAETQFDPDLVSRFSTHQEELKTYIERLAPFVQKGMTISSPANKYINYGLDKALEIIVSHEERHLQKAKTILD